MLRAIVMVAALSATTVHAEEYCPMTGGTAPIPEAVIGMEYKHIRPIMVDRGWESVPSEIEPSISEQAVFDEGFTEVDSCSGSDDAFPCNFLWRDEIGNDMMVLTRELAPNKREVTALTVYCRDTQWQVSHTFN
jgi:hypothetical protein